MGMMSKNPPYGGTRIRMICIGAAICVVAGCTQSRSRDGRNPSGSQAMISAHDYSALYVANAEEGIVSRVATPDLTVAQTSVGGEPTRLARINDRVFVTLRAERSILELRDNGERLIEVRRAQVGAEPYGVIAADSGDRLYVAVSMEGTVKELDAHTLQVLRVWNLPGEPRWLSVHPGGRMLYVAGTAEEALLAIDLESAKVDKVTIPVVSNARTIFPSRITGDIIVAPSGNEIAVPMLYANVGRPSSQGDAGVSTDGGGRPGPRSDAGVASDGGTSSGLGSGTYGSDILTPVIAVFPVDKAGRIQGGPRIFSVTTPVGRGYIAALNYSPDGRFLLAAIEGAAAVAVLYSDPDDEDLATAPAVFPLNPLPSNDFEQVPIQILKTAAGPRSVAFTDDDSGFVYSFLDRSIQSFDMGAFTLEAWIKESRIQRTPVTEASLKIEVAPDTLPADIEQGRRLFYAANDARMSTPTSGVSCATCHMEGRDDGFTWKLPQGFRQTPSLAGAISLREPLRWGAEMPTVTDDVLATSGELMGGHGLTEVEARNISAFVDYVRDVDIPDNPSASAAVARGKGIFETTEVGCANCHSGTLHTDLQTYSMFGLDRVKTSSLVGISATAPYLHDGSVPTLRGVLEQSRNGVMGNTASLSDLEMRDLEAYLQSL